MAYLNLELNFGTEDSLKKTLARAVQYNDGKHVYMSLLSIYEAAKNDEACTKYFAVATKKYKQSCKVWVQFAEYLF